MKRHAWKVCMRETVSRVRIPSPPPLGPMPYYVYILRSLKDDSFYIGQCDDLDKRMSKHFDGMSKYTASKRPLRLCYFEVFPSRSDAIKRERQIKQYKSKKYIQSLIDNRELARG